MEQKKEIQSEAELCGLCNGRKKCPICAGKGIWYEGTYDRQRCGACRGFGWCPECSGSGKAKTKPI